MGAKGGQATFSIPPLKDLKWNSPKDLYTGQSVYHVIMRAEKICHKCLIQLMVFITVMTLPLITHHLLKTSVNEAFPDCTGFRFLAYCIQNMIIQGPFITSHISDVSGVIVLALSVCVCMSVMPIMEDRLRMCCP